MVLKIFFSSLGNSIVLGQYDQPCVPHDPSTAFDMSSCRLIRRTYYMSLPLKTCEVVFITMYSVVLCTKF